MQKRVWVTWEWQRRSIELAKKLGCELFIIEFKGILRYPKSLFKTVNLLVKTKPDILFVQNPSMILGAFACIYRLFKETPIVIDRHTTFPLDRRGKSLFYIFIFELLHRFTLKYADLTIVTNDFLAKLVQRCKGNPFVLPDKIPDINPTQKIHLKGKRNILLISSFNWDEPIGAVLEAMRHIEESIHLYISGNYNKLNSSIISSVPSNVSFTGFLEDQEFTNMVFSVDIVMVLTTLDHCMLCGCYEAVAAGKPLITSEKDVLQDYFKGAIFVDNSSADIAYKIHVAIKSADVLEGKMGQLKETLETRWEAKYTQLETQLLHLVS